MRIVEIKRYELYVSSAEYELVRSVVREGYQLIYVGRKEEVWKLRMSEEELENILSAIRDKINYYLYEECYRARAEELRELLDKIYYVLHYDIEEE